MFWSLWPKQCCSNIRQRSKNWCKRCQWTPWMRCAVAFPILPKLDRPICLTHAWWHESKSRSRAWKWSNWWCQVSGMGTGGMSRIAPSQWKVPRLCAWCDSTICKRFEMFKTDQYWIKDKNQLSLALTLGRMSRMIWVKSIHDQLHKYSRNWWPHSKPTGMRTQRIHNPSIYVELMVASDEIHLFQ